MTIREVASILQAGVIMGEYYIDAEVNSACGSDMMSDVLAYVKNQSVLLTGLINLQVVPIYFGKLANVRIVLICHC